MDPKLVKELDEEPFLGMCIEDTAPLDKIEGRSACTNCCKSRKYFCYTCYIPVAELQNRVPTLKLPIKVDIIKHKHEIDGKSTAVHGAILAPNDVKIYTYPDIPNYSEKEKIYLIYPSVSAKDVASLFHTDLDISNMSLDEKPKHNRTLMVKSLDSNKINNDVCDLDELPIERAVFIDSTWNQSRGIYKDERIKRLPCLVIQNRASQFWRHQKGSPRWYLSTIEAIHQFVLEIHLNMWGVDPYYEGPYCDSFREIKRRNSKSDIRPYCGQYDNLLFFFTHMYKKIHSIYKHDQLLAYKRRLR